MLVKIPVEAPLFPCPSMLMLPALATTAPASPGDEVLDEILPPLSKERFPAVETFTMPAFPEPKNVSLKIPVTTLLFPAPSILMLPALTVALPPLPDEDVLVLKMEAPLTMEKIAAGRHVDGAGIADATGKRAAEKCRSGRYCPFRRC